jgi:hypothetical protein
MMENNGLSFLADGMKNFIILIVLPDVVNINATMRLYMVPRLKPLKPLKKYLKKRKDLD